MRSFRYVLLIQTNKVQKFVKFIDFIFFLQHLGQPKFLFCPTQYCTARAVPTVRNSEYLITIGSKLAPEINIMWTGDKVISKIISDEHLEDINDVLKRKCVIWDNEHANDYDQKRVFMGPYSGRSPEVKSKLSGINKYKYDIDLFEFLQFIVFEICLLLIC